MRHGQAQNNTQRILAGRSAGVPLTDLGRRQAEQAGQMLQHLDIAAIYSSPIQRARDTADIAASPDNIKVITDDRLVELEMGDFTGMRYDDIYSTHGNVFLKFYQGSDEIMSYGLEPFADVRSRIRDIMHDVTEHHPDDNVVLVTHMDPIKAAISLSLDVNPKLLYDLVVENASLNIFAMMQGTLFLSAVNLVHPSRLSQIWPAHMQSDQSGLFASNTPKAPRDFKTLK